MVTFRGDERYEKLKEYRAIPYGFLKLLAAMIVVAILIVNLIYFGAWLGEKSHPIVEFIVTIALFVAIVSFVFCGSREKWLNAYFSKNVRGFIARYWIGLTETGEQIFMCDVMRRGEKIDEKNAFLRPKKEGYMMIEIPLGGWFKSPRVASLEIENPVFIKKWKVRLIGDGQYIDEVQLRFKDVFYGNTYEDRVTLPLYDALLLLSRSADNFIRNKRRWDPACIGAYLLRRERELEEVIRKNNEDREIVVGHLNTRINELEGEVTSALERRITILCKLKDLFEQINSTTRLRTTLEGARLRVSIMEILTGPNGFSTASTEYNNFEIALPGARAEVERLERRRSGRSNANTAQAATHPAPSA